jgi:hypothetical protein
MRGLMVLGAVLVVLWLAGVIFFKVVGFAIHLLLIAGLILLVWRSCAAAGPPFAAVCSRRIRRFSPFAAEGEMCGRCSNERSGAFPLSRLLTWG